jgi:hypothetical protein
VSIHSSSGKAESTQSHQRRRVLENTPRILVSGFLYDFAREVEQSMVVSLGVGDDMSAEI